MASLGARFWLAWSWPVERDLKNSFDTLDLARRGLPIYQATDLYNYSPVWVWMLRALDALARAVGIPLAAAIRSFLAVVDGFSALVLFRIARRTRGALSPWSVVALFLANPVIVLVNGAQAEFDGVSLFFLLAAIALSRDRGESRSRPATALLLSLSVAVKHLTLFHPILWWRGRKTIAVVAAPLAVFFLLFLPYASQWRGIRDHVLLYRSVPNSYGFSEWVLADPRWGFPISLLAAGAALLAAWFLRRAERSRASLVLFLVVLVLAPGFGEHYVVWPLTIGSLFGGSGYFLVSLSWIVARFGKRWSLIGIDRWALHLIWLSLVFWLFSEVASLRLARRDGTAAFEGCESVRPRDPEGMRTAG